MTNSRESSICANIATLSLFSLLSSLYIFRTEIVSLYLIFIVVTKSLYVSIYFNVQKGKKRQYSLISCKPTTYTTTLLYFSSCFFNVKLVVIDDSYWQLAHYFDKDLYFGKGVFYNPFGESSPYGFYIIWDFLVYIFIAIQLRICWMEC